MSAPRRREEVDPRLAAARTEIDYRHLYHAGNVGDVWKHCVIVACLRALRSGSRPLRYIETHAGAGRYALGPTGEWTEGVGKLVGPPDIDLPPALAAYLELVARLGFRGGRSLVYPGSPALALALLGAQDHAVLHEIQEDVLAALTMALAGDDRVVIEARDGLAALPGLLRQGGGAMTFVLVDPPYVAKSEWSTVPEVLVESWRADPSASLALWYPIKSLTRPDALLRHLRAEGLPATALDLLTTPLELKRNRLNGSGVLIVNPPPGVVVELAAAAPVIGARCATHGGRWSTRGGAWGG